MQGGPWSIKRIERCKAQRAPNETPTEHTLSPVTYARTTSARFAAAYFRGQGRCGLATPMAQRVNRNRSVNRHPGEMRLNRICRKLQRGWLRLIAERLTATRGERYKTVGDRSMSEAASRTSKRESKRLPVAGPTSPSH